jgi:hypothetical protein
MYLIYFNLIYFYLDLLKFDDIFIMSLNLLGIPKKDPYKRFPNITPIIFSQDQGNNKDMLGWYITGLTDAEGNFYFNIDPRTNNVQFSFSITQKRTV